ncbi:uncharacterized protein LOC118915907 isoform X3 [Manis pentadactyla]|uniref:uncharacterized protein LOC118915907 isoform X3 n=1 Tax=Manis pentadactyla TaxID=143292 RepID=UPI00255CF372|nr:uncharacterized protein LOC118915907 isoform X3 [Manis pentadactyla]
MQSQMQSMDQVNLPGEGEPQASTDAPPGCDTSCPLKTTGPTGATGTTDFQKHAEVATTIETFIFAVKYQLAGLTHGSLTEAWPLSFLKSMPVSSSPRDSQSLEEPSIPRQALPGRELHSEMGKQKLQCPPLPRNPCSWRDFLSLLWNLTRTGLAELLLC